MSFAVVLRVAVTRGHRRAYATAAGISVLLTASRNAYTIMKIAGALYLAYLGARMLRDAFGRQPAAPWTPPLGPS
jgi:threonine/homoserine/homoserine lactone efflux protein